ncbi:hypothetical protein VTO42DRAFT_8012 [Malbranchea cinnamomea]
MQSKSPPIVDSPQALAFNSAPTNRSLLWISYGAFEIEGPRKRFDMNLDARIILLHSHDILLQFRWVDHLIVLVVVEL